MKSLFLFLLLCLCLSCVDRRQEKSIHLLNELDSVWSSLSACTYGFLQKQDSLLKEALVVASKKEKKKILQYGMFLSHELAQRGYKEAVAEGIKRCEELENNYSLSEELQWDVKRLKVAFWNEQERYKESLPLLNELLKEHRKEKKTAYIIEDLNAIATYFVRLGDGDKALSYYKEAYRLISEYRLLNLRAAHLAPIINLSYDSGRYREVIDFCNETGVDSVASLVPSTYTLLSQCYLHLQNPDSARFYLNKVDKFFRRGEGLVQNCLMAGTYLIENEEDSAAFYLNRAMQISKRRNKSASLPRIFMSYYSQYASLLLRRGKVRQAGDAFLLIEPLMKQPVSQLPRLKAQIDALYRFSDFYRVTKQYGKATEVLMYRDSILTLYNENRINLDNRNAIARFENQELVHENEIKTLELTISKRITGTSWTIILILSVILFACLCIIFHQRRRYRKFCAQHVPSHQQASSAIVADPVDPQEKFFRFVRKEVESKKLYLDKELTLDNLATRISTNRSTLSACINHSAGCNFNKWINSYRIDFSLERILSSVNLHSLAEECGFRSYNTFCISFKERIGCTPRQYIQIHKYDTRL